MAKRLFDVVVALTALIVLAPLLLLLALVSRVLLGPPVLFVQERAGKDGATFPLIKLRTMRKATGPDGAPLPDAERLTRWGRWLRATSLDELPELLNVVWGHMSLVGPRPLLARYLPRYSPEQARRHEVRPGITGWAQVHGRNATSWEERLALDVWYVDHRSAWLDLTILARTVWLVLRREGVSAAGHATMPEFRGADSAGAAPEGAEPGGRAGADAPAAGG